MRTKPILTLLAFFYMALMPLTSEAFIFQTGPCVGPNFVSGTAGIFAGPPVLITLSGNIAVLAKKRRSVGWGVSGILFGLIGTGVHLLGVGLGPDCVGNAVNVPMILISLTTVGLSIANLNSSNLSLSWTYSKTSSIEDSIRYSEWVKPKTKSQGREVVSEQCKHDIHQYKIILDRYLRKKQPADLRLLDTFERKLPQCFKKGEGKELLELRKRLVPKTTTKPVGSSSPPAQQPAGSFVILSLSKAKNRRAWGISGVVIGLVTLAVGSYTFTTGSAEGVTVSSVVVSAGAVMCGLGIANIYSSTLPPSVAHHKQGKVQPSTVRVAPVETYHPSTHVAFKVETFE
ncbi:MAG: hypothetical protein EP343_02975 [Deltaproteobacteria bacterium]|nr:MAG: hypothetical protein EP343_02975 [Deltaproteobacteria bacterium]